MDLEIKETDDGKEICPFCERKLASVNNHLKRNQACKKRYDEMLVTEVNEEERDEVQEALEEAFGVQMGEDEDKGEPKKPTIDVGRKQRIKWIKDLPFEEIKGISDDGANNLKTWLIKKKGFELTRQFAATTIANLLTTPSGGKSKSPISENLLKQAHIIAMNNAGRRVFTRAIDIIDDYETITTGIPDFDEILDGGFRTDDDYVIFGPYGCGKTQIAIQEAVNVQLEKEFGGLYDPDAPDNEQPITLWFDSEGTMAGVVKRGKISGTSRLREVAKATYKRYHEQGDDESDDEYEERAKTFMIQVLTNTIITDVPTVEDQLGIVDEAMKQLLNLGNVKLIVVDSLIANFRAEFGGRGTLSERQQKLNLHIHELRKLCGEDSCLIATCQVHDDPSGASFIPAAFSFKISGGNIVKHNLNVHLKVRKGKGGSIVVSIVDASYLPSGDDVNIKITPNGIEAIGA